jgi:hypothetical protein
MLPEYPEYLPLPLKFVRSNQTGETIIRTERMKGLARNRRWTSSPSVMFDAEWIMPNEMADLFIAWHFDVISDGADWFQMQSYYSGEMAERRTRFTGMYSGPDPISPTHVKISAQLEVFERPMIPPEWLVLPEYWYNLEFRSIFDLAVNQEWPEWGYQAHMGVFDFAINQEWPAA